MLWYAANADTSADLLWSEASRLISLGPQRNPTWPQTKDPAIYQAADADSLNSAGTEKILLQTRPLLHKRDSITGFMAGISGACLVFVVFFALLFRPEKKKDPLGFWRLTYLDNIVSALEVNHKIIWCPTLFTLRTLVCLGSIRETKQKAPPALCWGHKYVTHLFAHFFFVSLAWWKENNGELSLNQTSFNGPAVCWPSRVGWNPILSNTLHCAGNQITRGPTIHSTRVQFQRYNAIKAQ